MEDAEGPIPPDDGPVEDAVLVDMDGDDVAFIFSIFHAHKGANWSHICERYK